MAKRIKTVWLPKMNARSFYAFCKEHDACAEGLRSIRGKSLARFWKETNHGEWMLWLCCMAIPDPDIDYQELWRLLSKEIGEAYIVFGTTAEHRKQAAWLRKHVKVRP